ncbi:cadherin-related family member 4-like [Erpetoichthys calabaricus]|uniref:cadherin-related family member 4-like n=1 Tax=Erpetoichthys calabaricus TaxID=27687 RepID=UPI002234A50B|nr:cadherin-related family member 4-like [Erpetoichthys calabaricus]
MASVNFEYTASIIVKDVRYPELSAVVKVYITVTPVNQYYPQCHPPFSHNIKKNSPLSYIVGRVNATDRDWRFNDLRYSIIGGNPFPPLFIIDPHLGFIQLINTLQYEKRSVYKLEILIVDVNQDIIPDPINQKTTNCTITVNVEDTSITCYPWYIRTTICSTLPTRSSVANLNCKSWNSDFSYEITGGNTDQMFLVDQGNIFTKKTFNFLYPGIITPPNYEVLVVVSDNSQPYTSATATVAIQVVYCTTTTVTTTHTTTHTTRTTRIATMVDYYWAPDPWFVALMTVTGVLLLLLLLFIILKLLRRYGLCLPPPDEACKPLLQENSFTIIRNEPKIESNESIETGVLQTIEDETTMIVNQIPTEFDGKAVDPLTGKEYLYNSVTGERRWI